MNETTTAAGTDRTARAPSRGLDQFELTSDEGLPWFWIGYVPTLVIALALLLWGAALLFVGTVPAFLPALPTGYGGIDLIAVGVTLVVGPYGAYAAFEDRRNRRLEEQFPDFLTDLAANRKAGFTLAESVRLTAQSDYGPLTPEIERMAAQLTWNIPFEEALQRFSTRVDTPLVSRSITLVLEAERTGGYITDVLEAVSRDAREIKHLDRERRLSMRMYTIVMYVAFLVFLGVVAVLQAQLLPQLVSATESATGGTGVLGKLAESTVTLEEHRTFFYVATLVQALGSGSMAGMMARGRVGPGLMHAAVMILMGMAAFTFLLT